jgi:hypothetical protein
MANPELHGTPFTATASISGSVAVASVSGVAGRTYYVTDVSGSSDTATGTIVIKDATTIIWQERVSSTTPYEHTFKAPLKVAAGATVSVSVRGDAVAFANISGYSLP